MSFAGWLLDLASSVKGRIESAALARRWDRLRAQGMHIGQGVNLPPSTTIDSSHCFLISIGDWCGFGSDCVLLAHEGQFDEFLDAGRIGRVVIHPHSHIGTRSVILPGVEIGPRTIVGANSVVTKSLPPDTVCAGNPAKVICTLEEYLEKHRARLKERPNFPYLDYDIRALTPERRARLVAAVADGDAYIVGGWTATLRGQGGMTTTPFDQSGKGPSR
ncbi:MAG TPA: acyltransferase [Gemmatimonadales bacterium]|nr:acyltransferase [Gemmatimonadales bacterium]